MHPYPTAGSTIATDIIVTLGIIWLLRFNKGGCEFFNPVYHRIVLDSQILSHHPLREIGLGEDIAIIAHCCHHCYVQGTICLYISTVAPLDAVSRTYLCCVATILIVRYSPPVKCYRSDRLHWMREIWILNHMYGIQNNRSRFSKTYFSIFWGKCPCKGHSVVSVYKYLIVVSTLYN
jgi:hypothetical protein